MNLYGLSNSYGQILNSFNEINYAYGKCKCCKGTSDLTYNPSQASVIQSMYNRGINPQLDYYKASQIHFPRYKCC